MEEGIKAKHTLFCARFPALARIRADIKGDFFGSFFGRTKNEHINLTAEGAEFHIENRV